MSIDKMNTYEQFERGLDISPSSPEAYYAEIAWNEALSQLLNNSDLDDTNSQKIIKSLMTGFNG